MAQMRITFSFRNWLVLALFSAVAPFVLFYVQVNWSSLTVRALPLSVAKSEPLLALWLFGANIVVAAIAALTLAAPLAWLIRSRPLLLASFLAITTAAAALFKWTGRFTDLAALLTYTLLITFFLLCWVTASFVVRRARGSAHAT